MIKGIGDINIDAYVAALPEIYLCGWTLVLLMYGVYCAKRVTSTMLVMVLLVLGLTIWQLYYTYGGETLAMNGMFIADHYAVMAKSLVLTAATMVVMLSSGWLKEEGGRPFEFLILILFSTLGMMLMISAANLLTVYMGLEMMSLALYVLAGFNRDHAKSTEAGLKYFVLGALASGMMLFGMSLIYGFAGTTSFQLLSDLFLVNGMAISKGVTVGMILVIIGFCFKISAVPFHMWAPDVYEGAPTPVTAFFATAPKIAAFALFARLLMQPFADLFHQWQQVLIFMSAASMLVGALAAIQQSNIKRMLAYSSIGHVGFILMALSAGSLAGVQAMLIYLAVYIFMSAGAFGCVMLMRREGHYVEDIKDLAGLGKTRPVVALAMAAFMFSMAGIPPLAGFFGKMYAVKAAIAVGLTWLAVFGVITSVIGGYYYIRVVKVMYFDEPAKAFDKQVPFMLSASIAIALAVTLSFFLTPTPVVMEARAAAEALVK